MAQMLQMETLVSMISLKCSRRYLWFFRLAKSSKTNHSHSQISKSGRQIKD